MKNKNYENNHVVFVLFILLMIIEIIIVSVMMNSKIEQYHKMSGMIAKKNFITVIVDKKEKQLLYQNQNFFIKDKKISFEIEENKGVILNKNQKEYYEILIRLKEKNNYKTSDIVEIIIRQKKKRMIKIFKIIWEGD